MIKTLIKTIAEYFGFSIARKDNDSRRSAEGVLRHVATMWKPTTIIDVGAAYGDFSAMSSAIFPTAAHVLVEPLKEYQEALAAVTKNIPHAMTVSTAAGSESGNMEIHVHHDLVGSSLKKEVDGVHVDGEPRTVSVTTLDDIQRKHNLSGPFLLKIDVQGAEIDVLRGAASVLEKTECLILEVSFFRSMEGGADLYDMITFMKEQGFVAYDIASFLYRPYDGALSQADMVFVREKGIFRKFMGFATKEQRDMIRAQHKV